MKANTKKRKIFADAVDMLTEDSISIDNKDVMTIPIDKIKPYHNHPFKLYTGERLEDMVESVREHGVLNPVIINEAGGEYEMLSGHNRMNAAKIVGLKEVPAIVKKGLAEDEAYVYVVETNMIQRSFAELLPSEKAAVMSEHYQKICGTMKKEKILLELGRLKPESSVSGSGGHNGHRAKTRDIVAAEYGFSSRNAARYLRLNYLIQPFKDMVDENRMALLAAVDLSFLDEDEQKLVWKITDNMDWKIKPKMAAALRKSSGMLTDRIVADIIERVAGLKHQGVSIRISQSLRSKYFEGLDAEAILNLIDQAMAAWIKSSQEV